MKADTAANTAPRKCSRAGCRNNATRKVNWRNPRIHPDTRVKVWFACAEHVEFLHDYLASRGFPVLVTSIDETIDRVPDVNA